MLHKFILLIFFIPSFALASAIDAVKKNKIASDDAHAICVVLDSYDMIPLSEPCKVSVKTNSIDLSMDTNSKQAREYCVAVVMFAEKGEFEDLKYRNWKVRIYSPYSGNRTISQCNF